LQIIEVSLTGVRSAVITLQRESSTLRFVLFPMVHLGSAAFYADVTNRLRDCQLIVAEGVKGPSVLISALTLSYRLPGRSRRLNLAVQDIDYASLASTDGDDGDDATSVGTDTDPAGHSRDAGRSGHGRSVIYPDISARQFARRWRSLPVLPRLAVWCVIPLAAVLFRIGGTRRVLARHLGTTDLPTIADHALREKLPKFADLVLDQRDARLLDALAAIHEQRGAEPIKVAVVYGAGHMPAVVQGLWARYGYRPRAAEWLTVFDF